MREQWESLELLLANSGNSHTLTSTNAIEDADQGAVIHI